MDNIKNGPDQICHVVILFICVTHHYTCNLGRAKVLLKIQKDSNLETCLNLYDSHDSCMLPTVQVTAGLGCFCTQLG